MNECSHARAVDMDAYADGTELRRNVWCVSALKLGSHNYELVIVNYVENR
jgi:hypothetical protein